MYPLTTPESKCLNPTSTGSQQVLASKRHQVGGHKVCHGVKDCSKVIFLEGEKEGQKSGEHGTCQSLRWSQRSTKEARSWEGTTLLQQRWAKLVIKRATKTAKCQPSPPPLPPGGAPVHVVLPAQRDGKVKVVGVHGPDGSSSVSSTQRMQRWMGHALGSALRAASSSAASANHSWQHKSTTVPSVGHHSMCRPRRMLHGCWRW
jgi:hypothetical protein